MFINIATISLTDVCILRWTKHFGQLRWRTSFVFYNKDTQKHYVKGKSKRNAGINLEVTWGCEKATNNREKFYGIYRDCQEKWQEWTADIKCTAQQWPRLSSAFFSQTLQNKHHEILCTNKPWSLPQRQYKILSLNAVCLCIDEKGLNTHNKDRSWSPPCKEDPYITWQLVFFLYILGDIYTTTKSK